MKLYTQDKSYELYEGNMLDLLSTLKPNTIDAIVCDPPYELNFMNSKWDRSGIAFKVETWKVCLELLKPGGYLLAFGGSRTYHRIACAIEDAGFELRDILLYLYGSGFPKSHDVGLEIDRNNGVDNKTGLKAEGAYSEGLCMGGYGKVHDLRVAQNEWGGWGTCLKPAYEPIIMARKPLKQTIAKNLLEYRTGAINIDGCRVGTDIVGGGTMPDLDYIGKGRFPANVITDGSDEVAKGFPQTTSTPCNESKYNDGTIVALYNYNDSGSAMRFFYTAKASKKDRDEGLSEERNFHVCVKPTVLMQWLVRLVAPKGATILDPFMGSGSTGKACMFENRERDSNYHFIGVELTSKYLPIASARIDYALNKYEYDAEEEKQAMKNKGEMNLFEDFEWE